MVNSVLTAFQTYTVGPGKATPLIYGDPDNPVPGLIINLDLTDTMTIGFDMGVTVQRSDVMTVQPLQAIAYDGTMDIFGIMPAGQTAVIQVAPGMTYWAPSPAQTAAQINALGLAKESTQLTNTANTAATKASVDGVNTTLGVPAQDPTVAGVPGGIFNTGVPLYTKSTLVKNQANNSQAPGVTGVSATFPISQIGYEILLTIFAAGNFISWFHLTMSWFDSATGIQTGQEDYWFNPGSGSGANSHMIIGRGPTKGDQLVVTSSVPAVSSVNVTHSYVILQNSRLYEEDDWDTIQFNTAGFTGAAVDPTAGLLAGSSFSVGAGVTVTRVLPFFNGLVTIWANSSSGANDADFQLLDLADTSVQPAGSSAVLWEARTNANGFLSAIDVALPAGQTQMAVTNNNAAAKTLAFTVTASRQR